MRALRRTSGHDRLCGVLDKNPARALEFPVMESVAYAAPELNITVVRSSPIALKRKNPVRSGQTRTGLWQGFSALRERRRKSNNRFHPPKADRETLVVVQTVNTGIS